MNKIIAGEDEQNRCKKTYMSFVHFSLCMGVVVRGFCIGVYADVEQGRLRTCHSFKGSAKILEKESNILSYYV
jgi:hypothetical protein